MADISQCAVCQRRNQSSPSTVWCIQCKDEFCEQCMVRHSAHREVRHHCTIPIADYSEIPKSYIKRKLWYFLVCCEHQKPFWVFCRKHNIPCCIEGVSKYHNECKDICHLDQFMQDTDVPELITDFERKVNYIEKNEEQLSKTCLINLDSLSTQKAKIEQNIKQRNDSGLGDDQRKALDRLSKELERVTEQLKNRINKIMKDLNRCKDLVLDSKRSFLTFQALPRTVDLFLIMRNIHKIVESEERYITSLLESETMFGFEIVCDIESCLRCPLQDNELSTKKTNVYVKFNVKIFVPSQSHQFEMLPNVIDSTQNNACTCIEDIELSRTLTIRIRESNMRGCFMLKDGRMLITSFCICDILVINPDGTEDFRFKLRPDTAYDMVYMESDNVIVGASVGRGHIIFVDLNDRTIKRTIDLNDGDEYGEDDVFSVAVVGTKIIFSGEKKGIQILDLHNNTIKSIVPDIPWYTYITVFEGKIIHSNCETDEIKCYDFEGNLIWTFEDSQILRCPVGMSTDAAGNIFVLGCHSKNLVVISLDGKHCRELLWDAHGLINPRTISYNKLTNQILLANDQNFAFLYDVRNKNGQLNGKDKDMKDEQSC